MNIPTHAMEPWLIAHQHVPYNLGESGVTDQTVGEMLQNLNIHPNALLPLSLENNDTRGSQTLREAIAAIYPTATPETILVTTGSSEALWLYFHIRYTPGDNVVCPVPAFQSLYTLPEYLGYELRTLPLNRENGFRPDIEMIRQLVDDRTKTIILNNPHNPTGILLTEEEINQIIEIAEHVGAEILADEHYRFLPYDDTELIPSLYGRSSSVIATGSMIKCLGCVGLRVGWLIGPTELLEACRDLKDYTTHTICSINDFLAAKLLQQWPALIPRYKSWIIQNIASFEACIKKHPEWLGWIRPEAGIVGFPFLQARGVSSEYFAQELVKNEGVFLLPGESFDCPGYFRIGLGVEPNRFAEAMEKLDRHIRRWDTTKRR
ncbi:aminotransferase class I/II-fold pyridoxal phosphate-dependent enzyme [Desulfobulbus sp. TB]|nr:aminotransferase class I/II-fold pyridoxal phosphate-dependent enzyme [Desulfobulbus sp. TB]